MKMLLLLVSTFSLCNLSFAAERINTFYQPSYEIIDISPICPPVSPGNITCMAIGSKVKIKSVLNGCLDDVVFINDQLQNVSFERVNLVITAVAKSDPRNVQVRCVKMPEDVRTIIVPFGKTVSIDLVNQLIEN